ncbi:MAG: hypothetical protein Q9209_006212 [Squamulea sp. 1 TL-2023]
MKSMRHDGRRTPRYVNDTSLINIVPKLLVSPNIKTQGLLSSYTKLLSEMRTWKERSEQLTVELLGERAVRKMLQSDAQNLKQSVKVLRPFVVVLIDADADGYMFRADLLNKNEEGGLEAADELSKRVKDHLSNLNIDVSGTDIIVRAYANIGGLAQACTTKGGMTKLASLGSFVKGFNGRRALFDFVDVGGGKERADHKIKGMKVF